MPLPVISDVFRVTLNWGPAHGLSPRNVLHFEAASGDEVALATTLTDNFTDSMWQPVMQDWAFSSLDIIKLDGVSATVTVPIDPQGSLTSGDWIPNEAVIVSLHTGVRGPKGRGRVYLGPIAESVQNGGLYTSVSSLTTAWSDFANAMSTDGKPWVVASYAHAEAHQVTSLHVPGLVGSQRRRLDALR